MAGSMAMECGAGHTGGLGAWEHAEGVAPGCGAWHREQPWGVLQCAQGGMARGCMGEVARGLGVWCKEWPWHGEHLPAAAAWCWVQPWGVVQGMLVAWCAVMPCPADVCCSHWALPMRASHVAPWGYVPCPPMTHTHHTGFPRSTRAWVGMACGLSATCREQVQGMDPTPWLCAVAGGHCLCPLAHCAAPCVHVPGPTPKHATCHDPPHGRKPLPSHGCMPHATAQGHSPCHASQRGVQPGPDHLCPHLCVSPSVRLQPRNTQLAQGVTDRWTHRQK